MFGNGGYIRHIEMRSRLCDAAAATTWVERIEELEHVLQNLDRGCPERAFWISQAKVDVMACLGGPVAEALVTGTRIEALVDVMMFRRRRSDCDFYQAWNIARAAYRTELGAARFMGRMMVWTEQAFEHPQMWAAVESLAERLFSVKTRLSGITACKIMADAFGSKCECPYLTMGRRWNRRLVKGY
jgi:hypothetical protein